MKDIIQMRGKGLDIKSLEEIYNDVCETHELKDVKNNIDIEKEPKTNDLSMDPTVLAAIISGGAAIVASFISGIFAVWVSSEKRNKHRSNVLVVNLEMDTITLKVGDKGKLEKIASRLQGGDHVQNVNLRGY